MDILLKLVGLLGSYTQHILFSIASKQQGLVYLLLLYYIRTLKLSKRLYTKVILGLLQQYRALLIVYLAYSLTILAITFYIIATYSIIDRVKKSKLLIFRQALQTKRVGTSLFRLVVLLIAFIAIYRASFFQIFLHLFIIIQ